MNKSRIVKLIVSIVYLIAIVAAMRMVDLGAAIILIAVDAGFAMVVYLFWMGDYVKYHPDAGFWESRLPQKTGENEKLDRLCEWVYLLISLAVFSFFLVFFGSQIKAA